MPPPMDYLNTPYSYNHRLATDYNDEFALTPMDIETEIPDFSPQISPAELGDPSQLLLRKPEMTPYGDDTIDGKETADPLDRTDFDSRYPINRRTQEDPPMNYTRNHNQKLRQRSNQVLNNSDLYDSRLYDSRDGDRAGAYPDTHRAEQNVPRTSMRRTEDEDRVPYTTRSILTPFEPAYDKENQHPLGTSPNLRGAVRKGNPFATTKPATSVLTPPRSSEKQSLEDVHQRYEIELRELKVNLLFA